LDEDALDVMEANFQEFGFGCVCVDLEKPYDMRDFLHRAKLRDTRAWKMFREMNRIHKGACVMVKESRKGFWLLTNQRIVLHPKSPYISLDPAGGYAGSVTICRLEDVYSYKGKGGTYA